MEKNEKELTELLIQQSNGEGFLVEYLTSGISNENNMLYEYLVKDIFIDNFYVPRRTDQASENLAFSLFRDSTKNMLALQAHGGSGKTTYIKILEKKVENQFDVFHIDFGNVVTGTNPYLIVKQVILNRARKSLNKMLDLHETQAYTKAFEDYACRILNFMSSADGYQEAESIWKEIYDDIINPENTKVAEQINKVMRSLSFENINDILSEEKGLLAIQMPCLLFVTLLMTNPSSKKYLIVFDNVEALNSMNMSKLSTVITRTHNFIGRIYRKIDPSFFLKINFILCVRTTTNICIDFPHDDMIWGNNKEFIHQLEYEDFCADALLKKLKFLGKTFELKESKLYQDLYLLCSLLCPQSVIKKYLENDTVEGTDYKIFARDHLAAFFGNNFRQVVSHLMPIISDIKIRNKIWNLLIAENEEQSEKDNIQVNGARSILMHEIYKGFADEYIFSHFGIEKLSGFPTHSMLRVLLAFLYWDKYRYVSENSNSYSGASLGKIVDVFKNIYTDNLMEEFIRLIYKVSPLSKEVTRDGTVAISSWSYLVVIDNKSNLNIDISNISLIVDNYLLKKENEYQLRKIMISISDAGFSFFANTSNHFEFFNARNDLIKYSLFMYEKEKHSSKEYEFQFLIKENIKTLKNYVNGMLDICVKKCHYKDKDKECSYRDLEECIISKYQNFKYNKIFLCSLFIRYSEVSSAVINAINYVDRYRRYLWIKYKDKNIDNKILTLIWKYGEILCDIRNKVTQYKYFEMIVTKICDEKSNAHNIKFRVPKQAYYFKKWRKDYLFDAIDFLKKSTNEKIKSVFEICEILAPTSKEDEKNKEKGDV